MKKLMHGEVVPSRWLQHFDDERCPMAVT